MLQDIDPNIGSDLKDVYLRQLEELESLVNSTKDRVVEIRRDGFLEAGKLMGLID